jgi:hypothetical protein
MGIGWECNTGTERNNVYTGVRNQQSTNTFKDTKNTNIIKNDEFTDRKTGSGSATLRSRRLLWDQLSHYRN